MNIQAPIKYTAAEEALFQAAAGETAAQEKAIAQLRATGLPTRRVEAWHYTDLRSILMSVDAPQSVSAAPLLADAIALNDQCSVAGVSLNTWAAPDTGVLQNDDAIGQINAAMAACGTVVDIATDATIEAPLSIETPVAHSHNVVRIGAGASVTFVQTLAGEAGFATDITSIDVGAGAKATFALLCEKGAEAVHLGQIRISLGAEADLNIVVMNAGGKLIRREIVVVVKGENSNLDIKGVNLIGGNSLIDVTTVLDHSVPNTNSTQLFRNIATANGKGVFQGQIRVHQIAQKTDAQMACNTLLLSDDASFSAKPELEIFADDVICAHGATVTELDEDHLFYMMARGITERSAQALLIEAFVDEVVEELDDERLVEALEARIGAWLEANG